MAFGYLDPQSFLVGSQVAIIVSKMDIQYHLLVFLLIHVSKLKLCIAVISYLSCRFLFTCTTGF